MNQFRGNIFNLVGNFHVTQRIRPDLYKLKLPTSLKPFLPCIWSISISKGEGVHPAIHIHARHILSPGMAWIIRPLRSARQSPGNNPASRRQHINYLSCFCYFRYIKEKTRDVWRPGYCPINFASREGALGDLPGAQFSPGLIRKNWPTDCASPLLNIYRVWIFQSGSSDFRVPPR